MSPAVPHFDLEEERCDPGVQVVSVSGEIHVSTAPSFRERLNDVIESGEIYHYRDDKWDNKLDAIAHTMTKVVVKSMD